MNLKEQAAGLRFEGPVKNARGPARVSVGAKLDAALAVLIAPDNQVARDQVDFFPIIVDEGRGGMGAGIEAKMARSIAAFVVLIQKSGKNLLLDSRRISRRRLPSTIESDGLEFAVLLFNMHGQFRMENGRSESEQVSRGRTLAEVRRVGIPAAAPLSHGVDHKEAWRQSSSLLLKGPPVEPCDYAASTRSGERSEKAQLPAAAALKGRGGQGVISCLTNM